MRTNQWFVLAGVFFIGIIMFQIMASTALTGELMLREMEIDIINRTGEMPDFGTGYLLSLLRQSLYNSFTLLCWLGLMGCLICGWLESRAEKKEEKRRRENERKN